MYPTLTLTIMWLIGFDFFKNFCPLSLPGRCARVVSVSTCQAGGLWFKSSILPLLKHACRESDWLLCWPYTLAEVLHQRWISYHIHLYQVQIRLPTLALKLRGDITRSPKQGYQWPKKWSCMTTKIFLKNRISVHWFQTQRIICLYIMFDDHTSWTFWPSGGN